MGASGLGASGSGGRSRSVAGGARGDSAGLASADGDGDSRDDGGNLGHALSGTGGDDRTGCSSGLCDGHSTGGDL